MSYSPPPYDAADASWEGVGAYTRPTYDAADASWAPSGVRAVAVSDGPWAASAAVLLVDGAAVQIVAQSNGPWAASAALGYLPNCAVAVSDGPWVASTASIRALARCAGLFDAPCAMLAGDPVTSRFSAPAAICLAVRFAAPAALTASVRARFAAPAAMLVGTVLISRFAAVWSAPAGVVRIFDLAPLVQHALAGSVSPLGVTVSCDVGSPFWQAQIDLAADEYSQMALGDDLTLRTGADEWALVIDGMRRARPDGYTVTALSPVCRWGSLRAQTTLGAVGMARAVCERLLDQEIDWRCVDWPLPASAALLSGTPLNLARQIVAAVGSVLESAPDGSLVARPREPISPPTASGPVDVVITDDVLYAHDESAGSAITANRLTITSGNSSQAAKIDVIDNPADPTHRTVRAYPWPWMPITLTHTGDSSVTIGARVEVQTRHVEALVVVGGATTASYPVQAITRSAYRYTDLGEISHDGTAISPETAGETQIDLEYSARAWQWEVHHDRGETIQFLAAEG